MQLVLPDAKFKRSYITAQRELREEGRAVDIVFDELDLHFESFVQRKLAQIDGRSLPKGFVPCTEFWMVNGDHFLGRIVLRHRLNEALEKFGGHIGYEVRPTERNKGYGKLAVSKILPEAKELGLKEVLITCDDDNLGSIKIIEANGGELIDKLHIKDRKVQTRRYKIKL